MKPVIPNCHDREAARLRALALTAITADLKARFLKMAEQQEQLAEELRRLQTHSARTSPTLS
jgi:uncharacterized protein YicC (UPF0701 family)